MCPELVCQLKNNFEVDHGIAFDLRQNNYSWHLLPVFRAAISKKSNKLPSPELFKNCKDSIVGYWGLFATIEEVKFFMEADTLLALHRVNWQNSLFGQLCSSVEMTVLQRGVRRWTLQ